LIVAMLSLSTMTASAMAPDAPTKQRGERKLERVYRHYDRNLELRASVLGMTSDELRQAMERKSFDTLLHQHGFKDRQSFHVALTGKVKDELRHRGWSDQKIEKYLQKRLQRLGKLLPQKRPA
jgi:microsomal dipeptidase-like Zn-dependent dipeptidase